MKLNARLLLFLLMQIAPFSLIIAQKDTGTGKFILRGSAEGLDSGYIYLFYTTSDGKYVTDSSQISNGLFELSGVVNEPTMAFLRYNIYAPRHLRLAREFFLEAGIMHTALKTNLRGSITGSISESEFAAYNERRRQLDDEWAPVLKRFFDARQSKDTSTASMLQPQIDDYNRRADSIICRFVKDHPDSYVSAHLMTYQSRKLQIDSVRMLYEGLSDRVQQSRDGIEVKQFIDNTLRVAIGQPAPNFVLSDQDGNEVQLSDFRNKYVLLDFWASWCIPCREEHPYLKEAYSRFKNKGFEIIGISVDRDDQKSSWLEAIEKDKLPWTQLCDFKGWMGEVVNSYALVGKGIPANFLLNPEGIIIGKNLRGEEVEHQLKLIFK